MIKLDKLDQKEALRYLSYTNVCVDELTKNLLDTAESELLKILKPKYTYRVLPLAFYDNGVSIVGTTLTLTGDDIRAHLNGCHSAVLLCATLSFEADAYIRTAQVENLAKALVSDALLNAAIEQVCDLAEEQIKSSLPYNNYTTRFSPGYGDLPLSIQKDFISTLDAGRKIGVYLNRSDLMSPLKTVTAVIGISDIAVCTDICKCDLCKSKESCKYRKAGASCDV